MAREREEVGILGRSRRMENLTAIVRWTFYKVPDTIRGPRLSWAGLAVAKVSSELSVYN